MPETIDMEVLHATQMPTHALVILDASGDDTPKSPPIVAPVDIYAFNDAFNNDILRHPERSITAMLTEEDPFGIPHLDPARNIYVVTLPTVTIYTQHPTSVPVLLLFALWDDLPSKQPPSRAPSPTSPSAQSLTLPRTPPPTPASTASFQSSIATPPPAPPPSDAVSPALLAAYLLPVPAIEEFPAFAAMAGAMARACGDAQLAEHAARNQGLWRSALTLAPRDDAIVATVRLAWNVAREACRLRERERARLEHEQDGPATPTQDRRHPPPPPLPPLAVPEIIAPTQETDTAQSQTSDTSNRGDVTAPPS